MKVYFLSNTIFSECLNPLKGPTISSLMNVMLSLESSCSILSSGIEHGAVSKLVSISSAIFFARRPAAVPRSHHEA
ncbi:hypothetical protein D3C87_1457320 [compost metagenome]